MRFLYCACAISYILGDWSGVNIPLAVSYILSSVVCSRRDEEGGDIYIDDDTSHLTSDKFEISSYASFSFTSTSLSRLLNLESVKDQDKKLMEGQHFVELRLFFSWNN